MEVLYPTQVECRCRLDVHELEGSGPITSGNMAVRGYEVVYAEHDLWDRLA
jgi:hypothetical protein